MWPQQTLNQHEQQGVMLGMVPHQMQKALCQGLVAILAEGQLVAFTPENIKGSPIYK